MAEIVGGGHPVNDAERRVISYLRDHAPAEWLLLHNVEVPRGEDVFEVDLLVLTGHSLVRRRRQGHPGPHRGVGVALVPAAQGGVRLSRDQVARHRQGAEGPARLQGHPARSGSTSTAWWCSPRPTPSWSTRPDATRPTSPTCPGCITTLSDVSRVRRGCSPDARPYLTAILDALNQTVRRSTAPPRFGNWEVQEQLGGDAKVTEYRAFNVTLPGSETVLLRVYQADPLADQAGRAAERQRIANAYQTLARIPPHPCVVRSRDFFAIDDESRFVLVLDDVHGQALHLRLGEGRAAERDPGPAARPGPRARARRHPPRAHPGQRAGDRRRARGAHRLRLRQARPARLHGRPRAAQRPRRPLRRARVPGAARPDDRRLRRLLGRGDRLPAAHRRAADQRRRATAPMCPRWCAGCSTTPRPSARAPPSPWPPSRVRRCRSPRSDACCAA